MEKVQECYNNAEMYQCPRCENDTDSDGWYCDCCNPPQKVEFHTEEEIKNVMGEILNPKKDWFGYEVCPYCYNQLIDLVNS